MVRLWLVTTIPQHLSAFGTSTVTALVAQLEYATVHVGAGTCAEQLSIYSLTKRQSADSETCRRQPVLQLAYVGAFSALELPKRVKTDKDRRKRFGPPGGPCGLPQLALLLLLLLGH